MEYTQNLVCENDNCKMVHSFDERTEIPRSDGSGELVCPSCHHSVYYEVKLSKTQKLLLDKMVEISSKPITGDAIGRHKWINSRKLYEATHFPLRVISDALNKLVKEELILKKHHSGEYNQFALKVLKGFTISGNLINAIPKYQVTTEGGLQ